MTNDIFGKAKWICPEEFSRLEAVNIYAREHQPRQVEQPSELQDRHFIFKKQFTFNKDGTYRLRVTADDYYKAYINGRFVGQGPCQGYFNAYYWNEYDVTDYLLDGENTVELDVYYHGVLSHAFVTGDRRMGAIASITGNGFCLDTDETWLCTERTEFTTKRPLGYTASFCEDIDLTKKIRNFKPACVRKTDYTFTAEPAKSVQVYSIKPQTTQSLDKNTLFCDFGGEITASLRIKANGKAGSRIEIYMGEETEDSELKTRWHMRCNCECRETFTLSGENSIYEQYDYRGFRYASLVKDDDTEIESVEAVVRHYPFDDNYCELETDDEILKSVWNICKRGVKYGSQEIYVDCPQREKGQYSGDMTVTSGAQLILTGDASLLKKSIDNMIQSSFIDDGLMAVAPSSGMQEIADYSLQFPIWAIRYYDFTKDRAYLEECLSVAETVHSHFRQFDRGDGLLDGVSDKWNLVDWPQNMRDNYDFRMSKPIGKGCHNVINAFYVGFVKQTDEMRELLGKEPTNEYKALEKAFNNTFFDKETKLYVDSEGSGHSALHSNILPLYYGICPDEAVVPIKNFMMKKKLCCGVYMSFFFLKGLLRYGFREEAYGILTSKDENSWYNMVREGATTCFEAWGKEQKNNCSLCHPWASTPIEIIRDLGLLKKK